MTASSGAADGVPVDGCGHCGNRAVPAEDTAHRQRCAEFHAARRAALEVSEVEAYGIPAVAADDLFAHLVSERLHGAWCTPDAAAHVVRTVAALGWRPVVGRDRGRWGQ